MYLQRFGWGAIAAFFVLPGLIVTGLADSPRDRSITLAEQGSFFVGGRILQGSGIYDPAKDTGNTNEGNTFWTDQMYVQYQIPANPRKYPLVLVHGGGGTGRVWETTPDGREGYQTLFVRRGFAVYIVDFPRRGRAGFPSFNGPFGEVDGTVVVANKTNRRCPICLVALAVRRYVDGTIAALQRIHEIGKALPLPSEPCG
jgi:pimeloyl-ACP methyl ester carboxylesterase